MDIFGIPLYFIILIIILYYIQYTKEKEKKKEEALKKWNAIHVQMDSNEVINELGQPHRVCQAGRAEIWCYGSNDSDGIVRFIDGKVFEFQKPNILKT